MKVLLLSTYEKTGGAAIAASRLLQALRKSGVDATMMCRKNLSWWNVDNGLCTIWAGHYEDKGVSRG